MLDTETGEWQERRVEHSNGQARQFYATLPAPALVGLESRGYARWFAGLLAEMGHELAVGHAAKIRATVVRKQKTDRNDARHLLELLRRGEFPRIWLPSVEERDVRVLLEHRHGLVQMRTRVKNAWQALAMNYGLCQRRKLWSGPGREQLSALPMREGMARRRGDLVRLLEQLDCWIGELDQRLACQAGQPADAQRLMTHPGVGVLSALATPLILGPVETTASGWATSGS